MARVFSAVDVEDKELLEELKDVRDRMDLSFKPVETEKMHITLQFFQDIDEEEVEDVKEAMNNISKEPFTAEVNGVDVFPSRDYIRVVWAGVEKNNLSQIYSQVSDHDVDTENNHDFTPHITLMRVENLTEEEKRKLQKMLDEFEDHYFGELNVDKIRLYRSDLGPKGANYRKLHEKKL